MDRAYSRVSKIRHNWIDRAIDYAGERFESVLNLVKMEGDKGVGKALYELLDQLLISVGMINNKYKSLRRNTALKKGGLERLGNTVFPLNGTITLDRLQEIIKGK
jgi:hypothetical protein